MVVHGRRGVCRRGIRTYVRDADLAGAMAPQFASQTGLIASLPSGQRDLGHAAGQQRVQRRVMAPRHGDGYDLRPNNLAWSPTADALVHDLPLVQRRASADKRPRHHQPRRQAGAGISLHRRTVVVAGCRTRMAVVTGAIPGDMGSGWKGVPGIIDVRSGTVAALPLPSEHPNFGLHDLPSASASTGPSCRCRTGGTGASNRTSAASSSSTAKGAGSSALMSAGEYWSFRVVAHDPSHRSEARGVHRQYTFSRVVQSVGRRGGIVLAAAAVPAWSPNRGGRCGNGADMDRAAWSRDGLPQTYGFMFEEASTNGLWTFDVASGQQSLLPVANTFSAQSGPATARVRGRQPVVSAAPPVGSSADNGLTTALSGRPVSNGHARGRWSLRARVRLRYR